MKTRLTTAILASAYFIYYCFTYTQWHFLDNVNLIIHESGHVIFMFFGTFMHILGGSLWQILSPIIFVCYFYRKKDYFSASLILFWVGQNIINVSVYASDAIVMQLPLLGSDGTDTSGHDWHNILTMLGALKYTYIVGETLFITGICVILCAIYLSIKTSLIKNDSPTILSNN